MICRKCAAKEDAKARLEEATMLLVTHGLDLGEPTHSLTSRGRKLRLVFESDFQELRRSLRAAMKAAKTPAGEG